MNRKSLPFRIVATGAVLTGLAGQAFAARPDTRAYTCAQNRAAIAQYGSLVMTTGQFTYARIVHNRGFCGPGQQTKLHIVPSLDDPRCHIGYICDDSRVFSDR